ncbi:hypothetical protein RXP20_28815, partial [Pseudomonas aeruginosa]|nr:hypothetical protein [Pseudomonas aeruginosa]
MTLAEMRHRGAIIELKDGGINVRRTTDAITAALTQNKAAIIATLKRERLDGIDYHDSKVYWSLNVLYDNWHRLPNSEERDNALLLLRRWDNVLTDNFRDGARMVAEEQPMLELIAESVPLAGVTLHRAVSEIV